MSNNPNHEKLTAFFSETVNSILKFEELLSENRPEDISHKEMHVIEAIAKIIEAESTARASEIAAALKVAPGTFTTAADVLEKKGYLIRTRDETDQRSIRVTLTEKGLNANAGHQTFHQNLAAELLDSLNENETKALLDAIDILQTFYTKKENVLKGGKVKILADSSCDIKPEDAARLGVTLVPMSIIFDDQTYRQNVDMNASEFFKRLSESDTIPTTTQLTPYDLEQVYREATKDGSEVVAVHLSSAISGTYQSAVLAAREVPGVYTVDSQNATMGLALLVRIAAEMRDSGKSAQEIAKKLTELSEKVILLAYIPTLKYLVRGGRVSAAAGLVGSALNIYPLISFRDGAVRNIGKARGKSMAQKEIAKLVEERGIDKAYPLNFGHASASTDMEALKIHLENYIEECDILDCEIGAVIGTHTGPGAVGLAFIAER